MRIIFTILTGSVIAASSLAANLPLCEVTEVEQVSYESSNMRVTFIQGNKAANMFSQLEASIEPDTQNKQINAVIKKTPSLVCGQYEMERILNGESQGSVGCLISWCNRIERF